MLLTGVCVCVCVPAYVHMHDIFNLGAVFLSFEALTVSV